MTTDRQTDGCGKRAGGRRRAAADAKLQRIEISLSAAQIAALDALADGDGHNSRSRAAREIIAAALKSTRGL